MIGNEHGALNNWIVQKKAVASELKMVFLLGDLRLKLPTFRPLYRSLDTRHAPDYTSIALTDSWSTEYSGPGVTCFCSNARLVFCFSLLRPRALTDIGYRTCDPHCAWLFSE